MEDQIDIVARMAELTKQALRDEIKEEDLNELRKWLSDKDNRSRYWSTLFDEDALNRYTEIVKESNPTRADHGLYASFINKRFKVKRVLLPWAAVGAVLIGFLSYFRQEHSETRPLIAGKTKDDVIVPGSNKAILTLGGGIKVALKDGHDTTFIITGGTIVQKGGSCTYFSSGTFAQTEYNVLNTPKGGQWHLVLPDGSEVWLNAASSIRYPAAFRGTIREVSVTGEAFFKVKNSPSAPFIVKAPHTTISVLGTSFNINASSESSPERTTLITGRVEVASGGRAARLRPGHQAAVSGNHIVITPADTATAVAWREGLFVYDQASLNIVMKDIENWYDVNVIFAEDFENMPRFSGMINRNTALSKFLRMISDTKIAAFKIEGRTITIRRCR